MLHYEKSPKSCKRIEYVFNTDVIVNTHFRNVYRSMLLYKWDVTLCLVEIRVRTSENTPRKFTFLNQTVNMINAYVYGFKKI